MPGEKVIVTASGNSSGGAASSISESAAGSIAAGRSPVWRASASARRRSVMCKTMKKQSKSKLRSLSVISQPASSRGEVIRDAKSDDGARGKDKELSSAKLVSSRRDKAGDPGIIRSYLCQERIRRLQDFS